MILCFVNQPQWYSASILGSARTLIAATTLFTSAYAQSPQPPRAPADALEAATSARRYSAGQLKLAFDYMDRNHDGKISREEASGFRGVAKNFDRADTYHDNSLSREEFDKAMNHVTPP